MLYLGKLLQLIILCSLCEVYDAIFFYCTPNELKEIFSEVELTYPIVYEPRFGCVPRMVEIDTLLRRPLDSCRDFYQFGKGYRDTPPFYIYTAEDKSRRTCPPNLLYFSGTPASLIDTKVLCEGCLFLEPENKEDAPRTLYKHIRRLFAKRFIKSGYCFISPAVYTNRGEYLFIQRDYNFLAPAWCFDHADQHSPIDIDAWYQEHGKMREQYQTPGLEFKFFAVLEDLEQLFIELAVQYNLKYIEVIRQENGSYQETVFDTMDMVLDAAPYQKRTVYIYDQLHRMLLYPEIDHSWEQNGKIAGVSKALAIQNVFGDKLYQDFVAKVKEHFQKIDETHYGPLYISPILYAHRSGTIFSLHDPYFRIDENDKAVHVWSKEWEE